MDKDLRTVVCYGDSNTYGYNPEDGGRYPREKRWVNMLASMLGDEYDVISEGLNGRTTGFEREGEPWKNGRSYLKPCLATHRPIDILIFMLGTNDCMTSVGVSPEQIAESMENLILDSRDVLMIKQGSIPTTVIIAPAAIRPEIKGTAFEDTLDETAVAKSHAIVPLYRELAEKYGCIFIDVSDKAEVSELDCIHLSKQGHETIAKLVYETIKGQ